MRGLLDCLEDLLHQKGLLLAPAVPALPDVSAAAAVGVAASAVAAAAVSVAFAASAPLCRPGLVHTPAHTSRQERLV